MSQRRREDPPFSLFAFQDIITAVSGIMILMTLILALELITRTVTAPPVQAEQVSESVDVDMDEIQEEIRQLNQAISRLQGRINASAGVSVNEINDQIAALIITREELTLELERLESEGQLIEIDQEALEAAVAALDGKSYEDLVQEMEEARDELERLQTENVVIFIPEDADEEFDVIWLVELDAEEIRVGRMDDQASITGGVASGSMLSFTTPEAAFTWACQRNSTNERFMLLIKPGGAEMWRLLSSNLHGQGYAIGNAILLEEETVVSEN